ncbi:iron-sulfur cluster biosynthesis family protein [Clostridium paraputrificum]|uniref:iron-sulfur cluster biosynthesis family protein n=1 Tax=Clostridium TaxID=1485 RepID=UPI003D3527D1
MKIEFDEKTKKALEELVNNSSENSIRIKVFRGCGKPGYEIFPSFKGEYDEEVNIDGINFLYYKDDKRMIDGIEIKYDKDIYNNGFYIRSL